jgi:hypothetical protein
MDAIPFEAQQDTPAERRCGAAALCMVYRSFGLACTQAEVWQEIARPDSLGNRCARTYLLAQDALRRGLAALVVQADDAWQTLRACAAPGLRVILNHRIAPDSTAGHYSVLVGFGDEYALVHDPRRGPGRRLGREELLALWRPFRARSEITGQVLAAFADGSPPVAACPSCGQSVPPSVPCLSCRAPIALRPAAALGCGTAGCPGRTWKRLFCPQCDTARVQIPGFAPAKAAARPAGVW